MNDLSSVDAQSVEDATVVPQEPQYLNSVCKGLRERRVGCAETQTRLIEKGGQDLVTVINAKVSFKTTACRVHFWC